MFITNKLKNIFTFSASRDVISVHVPRMIFAAITFFLLLFVLIVNIFVSFGLSLLLTFLIYFVFVCSSHAPRQLESGTAQIVRRAKDVLWRKKLRCVSETN